MAEYSEPHDKGPVMNEEGFTDLFSSFSVPGVDPLVASSLEVYTDGDGRQVKVRVGKAYVYGHRYRNDALLPVALPANSTGTNRTDFIILRFQAQSTDNPVASVRVALVTAGSGTTYTPLQSVMVYEIVLARVTVAPNFNSVPLASVTDLRVRAQARTPVFNPTWFTPTLTNGFISTTDLSNQGPRYTRDQSGLVTIEGQITRGNSGNLPAFVLPVGFRPLKNKTFSMCRDEPTTGGVEFCAVVVAANGGVVPIASANAGGGFITLNSIQFYAEQ